MLSHEKHKTDLEYQIHWPASCKIISLFGFIPISRGIKDIEFINCHIQGAESVSISKIQKLFISKLSKVKA